jgi:hypothetical protein
MPVTRFNWTSDQGHCVGNNLTLQHRGKAIGKSFYLADWNEHLGQHFGWRRSFRRRQIISTHGALRIVRASRGMKSSASHA